MSLLLSRACTTALLSAVTSVLLCAQDWKTAETLPGTDLSGLPASQKAKVLKVLRTQGCTCGCDMKLAECRVVDPGCGYSTALSAVIASAIKSGKSEAEAVALAKASKFGHPPEPPPVLEAAVAIPVAGAPVTGPLNAVVTIVEFSDFQCPYCAVATPEIEALLRTYPTQVKLIFKQYPLEMHPQAPMAAAAAISAQKQDKFWQMHDALFNKHDQLSRDTIYGIAKDLGLDMKQFDADINSKEVHDAVTRDMQDGDHLGVEGTPTLFINGQRYNGPVSEAALKPVVEGQMNRPATVARASHSVQSIVR